MDHIHYLGIAVPELQGSRTQQEATHIYLGMPIPKFHSSRNQKGPTHKLQS